MQPSSLVVFAEELLLLLLLLLEELLEIISSLSLELDISCVIEELSRLEGLSKELED